MRTIHKMTGNPLHKHALLLLVAMLVLASLAQAQRTTADRFSGIGPKMQEFVDRGEVSGVVTLVADREKVLHLNAVGTTDLRTNRPMKTDDLFWIASMTKPIVGIAIAILKDEGKLSFDDPVEKYVPEFATITLRQGNATTRPSRSVTLRDLLAHTGGVGEMNSRQPHLTLEQTAAAVGRMSLRFEPGTRWGYSTAGIDVLGRVVEVVSGMTFDQFLQAQLFEPLGMKETTFWLSPEQETRFARNYRLNTETGKLEETTISYLYRTDVGDRQRPPLGGAGLFSTAEDIARIYQMMLNNGSYNGRQILKPETVAEMLRKQTGELRARPGMPWGLGFCIIEDPKQMRTNDIYTPGSFGHGGAHGTSSWADPSKGLIYIIMLQRGSLRNADDSDMRHAFQQEAAKALAPQQ